MNDMPMNSDMGVREYLRGLGPFRLALAALAAILIVFSPSPEMETVRSGWGLVRTAVLPALGPVVFMVVLFDMLMSRVMMSDHQGAERARYRRALWFDTAVALLMLLAWAPFLLALFETR